MAAVDFLFAGSSLIPIRLQLHRSRGYPKYIEIGRCQEARVKQTAKTVLCVVECMARMVEGHVQIRSQKGMTSVTNHLVNFNGKINSNIEHVFFHSV